MLRLFAHGGSCQERQSAHLAKVPLGGQDEGCQKDSPIFVSVSPHVKMFLLFSAIFDAGNVKNRHCSSASLPAAASQQDFAFSIVPVLGPVSPLPTAAAKPVRSSDFVGVTCSSQRSKLAPYHCQCRMHMFSEKDIVRAAGLCSSHTGSSQYWKHSLIWIGTEG